MAIFMGGSGSVGSTLLASVLNRHPEVFCGPELSIFNKEIVFADWRTARDQMMKHPDQFITWGWGPYSGSNVLHEAYGWCSRELRLIATQAGGIAEFSDHFFERPLSREDKTYWVEKTPSNALCFPELLDNFEGSQVVHIIRNPYDSVASLVRRGFSPIYATGIWVYNCAMGLRVRESKRYNEVKYEHLTSTPLETLETLTSALGLGFNKSIMVENGNIGSHENHASWDFLPSDQIGASAVSSFQRTPTSVQDEIRTALSVFRVSDKHRIDKNVQATSCLQICDLIGYDFEHCADPKFRFKISADLSKDVLQRTLRRYKTGYGNFPAKLSW